MQRWWRRVAHSRLIQVMAGSIGAFCLRLVWRTLRVTIVPADIYDRVDREAPVIVALWHGQHFLAPFIRRPTDRAKVLISRHRDGEVNAIAAERLGIGTIRGSGTHGGQFQHKGGVSGFVAMVAALKDGYNVVLTADIPKVSRVAGLGIVMLARASGRPIYPLAIATSRRFVVDNWDRSAINLPFGRGAAVIEEPIRVPADADDAVLESCRHQVEAALNRATERAYAMVDRKVANAVGG
jgi:lysophospholipid acyltransferase (LPLAT)-like uncharacterized protein